MKTISVIAVLCVASVTQCLTIAGQKSVKDQFCDSDFAVKAKILSDGHPSWGGYSLHYDIKFEKIYLGQNLIPKTYEKGEEVFTNTDSRGVNFTKGKDYIFSGYASPETTLSTYTENIVADVEHLTPEQTKFFIDGQYKNVTC